MMQDPSTQTGQREIKCKGCGRVMATTSPAGLLLADTQRQACDTCRDLETLHADMQTMDQNFKLLESRRLDYAPRYEALSKLKASHIAVENYLLRVEAPPGSHLLMEQDPALAPESVKVVQGGGQMGTKRLHAPVSARPSPQPSKRRRLVDARRVSFDSSVVIRDDRELRTTDEFQRGTDQYKAGRHAAPEGIDYLDTSGSNQAPTKFTGLKRMKGGKWVEVIYSEENIYAVKGKGKANARAKGRGKAKANENEQKGEEEVKGLCRDIEHDGKQLELRPAVAATKPEARREQVSQSPEAVVHKEPQVEEAGQVDGGVGETDAGNQDTKSVGQEDKPSQLTADALTVDTHMHRQPGKPSTQENGHAATVEERGETISEDAAS